MFEMTEVLNPFPGLRPFLTDEYNLFFGREGQSDELLDRLRRTRFLAVVGTSGSGKSSLIRAGLLPALFGGLMAGTGSNWRVALFRPGNDPIGNLALALADEEVLGGSGREEEFQTALIETTLRRSTLGLVDAVRQARIPSHENLLVVVDQFEELFRFNKQAVEARSGDEAPAFVKLLLEASQQTEVNIYVVLTMRSDYLGDCAQFWGLPEAINSGQYLIPRMTRDERNAAITGPAAVGGGEITQPLVNRILNDMGDNPDHLPIMQHALMRTWMCWKETRQNGQSVDLEHYELVGGMARALAIHATQIYSTLPDEDSREIARVLFQALTEKGEDNREIRRPTQLKDICAIAEAAQEKVVAVIDVFRGRECSFLMPPIDVELEPETVIDISHESLIRNWDLLKAWVDEESESARMYRRLATEAVFSPDDFWSGARLQSALDWRELYKPNAAWAQRYNVAFEQAMAFLDASQANRDQMLAEEERQRQAEAERERRELAHAQMLAEERQRFAESEQRRAEEQAAAKQRELEQAQAFAEKQARAAQRLRRFTLALIVISVVAVVSAIAAGIAFANARRSQAKANDAKIAAEGLAEELRNSGEALQKNYAKLMDAEKGLQEQTEIAKKRAGQAEEAKKKADIEANNARVALARLNTEVANDHRNRDALASFLRGNMTVAEESLLKLLPLYREQPQRQAWVRSYLGATRRKLGKTDDSIQDLKTAIGIYERGIIQGSLRKSDPEYLDSLTWLAHAYTDKGQYTSAQGLFKGVLAARRNAGEHADLADSLENLARNYNDLGQPEEAEKLYNEALDLRRSNRHSPDLTAALREVANFELEHEDPGAAVALYEEALNNQEPLEPDDPNIADTLTAMAQVYEFAGDNMAKKRRAERLRTLGAKIRQSRLLNESSDGKVDVLEDLARSYLEVGRLPRAEQLLIRAQNMVAQLHGAESKRMVNHLFDHGEIYRYTPTLPTDSAIRTAVYQSASVRYQQALEISKRKSFANEELRTLDAWAGLLLEKGDFAGAEPLFRRALEIRERNPQFDLFPEHMLIENLNGLAQSEVRLGGVADAEAHLLQALKVFDGLSEVGRNFLGGRRELDAYILRHSTSARLAELYRTQGKFKEADERYRPLAEGLKTIRREYMTGEYTASKYLEIIESAGRFYTERGDVATAESFYRLLWPAEVRPVVRTVVVWPEDVYAKTPMALAPVSCVDNMIRILNSYETLLAGAGRQREADEISHGVVRLEMRKTQ